MRPKIISIGIALPAESYTQDELFNMLGYKSSRIREIFQKSGIKRRYLWTNPVGKSWQELTQEYQKAAVELSCDAILSCMDGGPIYNVGCLIYSSCTGYTCPGISHHIARQLNLANNLIHADLLGMGCEASAPSLARAVDYVIANNRRALMVSCEACSCAYFPAPENDLENTIVNCLFGDAAAAVLIGYDDDHYHPEIIDIHSYFNKDYLDYLGFKWVDGRLKCVLDRNVPKVSGMLVKTAVDEVLLRHNLKKKDIKHWAIHPGGLRVLEEIQKSLSLSREKLALSYEVLNEVGNVSSATVIIIGKHLNRVKPPAWGIGVTLGAGFEVGVCLLRWS